MNEKNRDHLLRPGAATALLNQLTADGNRARTSPANDDAPPAGTGVAAVRSGSGRRRERRKGKIGAYLTGVPGYERVVERLVTREFEPHPGEVSAVRRFVRQVAADWGVNVGDLELVVGELAANAVLHARSPYEVCLRRESDRVVVEVADHNARLPAATTVPARSLSGRGLTIVAELSRSWGIRPEPEGKVIWAELWAPRLEVPA